MIISLMKNLPGSCCPVIFVRAFRTGCGSCILPGSAISTHPLFTPSSPLSKVFFFFL